MSAQILSFPTPAAAAPPQLSRRSREAELLAWIAELNRESRGLPAMPFEEITRIVHEEVRRASR